MMNAARLEPTELPGLTLTLLGLGGRAGMLVTDYPSSCKHEFFFVHN